MKIVEAIRSRHVLRFSYGGYIRTVEPHAYGIDRRGRYVLRAYQTAGGSESGEYVGWKLFREEEMVAITGGRETFRAARPDYRRGDRAIVQVIEEL